MKDQINEILNRLFVDNGRTIAFDFDPAADRVTLIQNGSGESVRHDMDRFHEVDLGAAFQIPPEDAASVRAEILNAAASPKSGTMSFHSRYQCGSEQHYRLQYLSFKDRREQRYYRVVGIVTGIQGEMERQAVIDGFSEKIRGFDGMAGQNLTISQQVFEILYSTPDVHQAIRTVLSVLGTAYRVDRVYIFEDTEDHQYCCNTFEWCAEGISPEIENLRRVSYEQDLGGHYQDNFDQDGAFLCPDISLLPQEQYEILAKQGIFSMLQCAITENGVFQGYIGFDACGRKREWSREQLRTLMMTTKVVGTFLCKKRHEEALSETNRNLQNLINRIPGGVGIYEARGDRFYQLYLNDGYYTLLGDSRENRTQYAGTRYFEAVHPEDIPHVRQEAARLLGGTGHLDMVYRCINRRKRYTWLRMVGNAYRQESGKVFVYCTYANVDEQMAQKLALEKNQALLNQAMQAAKMISWEYDVEKKCIYQAETSQLQHGYPSVVENVPESLIADRFVHPGSVAVYRGLFVQIPRGGAPLRGDVLVRTPDRKGYWWERIIMTPIYDQNGKHVRSLGTTIDVTEQKRLERRYRQQLRELETVDSPNLMAKAWYNLTENCIQSLYERNGAALKKDAPSDYDADLKAVAGLCSCPEKRQELLQTFGRERLIREFREGNTDFTVDYQRKTAEGAPLWVRDQSRTFEEPESGAVMCMIYSYDLTEQKTTEEMIQTVVRLDYDYLAQVNLQKNRYVIYCSGAEDLTPLPPMQDDYEKSVREYAHTYMSPEEADRNIRDMSIANVRAQLKNSERFTCYVNVRAADGTVQRKLLQFSYMDRANERVLLTRVDVSDIYRKEQAKVEELQAAKDAAESAKCQAEEASGVKAQFLSRMSHDLRTPMNAIIGLSTLAEDELADPAAMKRYVSSIRSAGSFLLGLVNDCLDYEKLTASKMLLHPQTYTCGRFLTSIRTMIEPLCRAKQITFVLDEKGTPGPVVTDPIRFEQIFFNLLTNAVKFTPEGGRVELRMIAHAEANGILPCDFLVRDTGIGMSREFQKRMYEPFEQEQGESAQMEGTGLGLTIVKNLVELMGGTIRVKSEPDAGTEFTVRLDLPTAAKGERPSRPGSPKRSGRGRLEGMHVLLVEDHPLNTEIAVKLLEKRGVRVSCAVNGREGVDRFAASPAGTYQAILMDVRMPVMNGLEATRAIRALPREDALRVPILAMTANAFEEDVRATRAAGMNEHLSKPVEPEKLYAALERWTAERTESNPPVQSRN
ncbi:MAG: ATP-binding protein [Oscillibacter sp.]|jgi:signal transduction histidine kinase/PAS domain-containing protein/ActR/RegA family two-component response regulator|nr:ATP-binding protein [Oscillibacter sp.]